MHCRPRLPVRARDPLRPNKTAHTPRDGPHARTSLGARFSSARLPALVRGFIIFVCGSVAAGILAAAEGGKRRSALRVLTVGGASALGACGVAECFQRVQEFKASLSTHSGQHLSPSGGSELAPPGRWQRKRNACVAHERVEGRMVELI